MPLVAVSTDSGVEVALDEEDPEKLEALIRQREGHIQTAYPDRLVGLHFKLG